MIQFMKQQCRANQSKRSNRMHDTRAQSPHLKEHRQTTAWLPKKALLHTQDAWVEQRAHTEIC